ncbi:PLxRFG domain-containing protein [Ottowia sp. VDI28]|uniref:PLxRFG domain-containing protein n=1 Tax=Ottowia sp. VDI28 TaxID=3133968 RepID=UPI003C2C6125
MKNVGEFVAEAFTNPEFQNALRQMQGPVGGSIKSAWEGFVRVLRSILGLSKDASDALSQALSLGAAVMREDKVIRERSAREARWLDQRIEPVPLKLQGWTGSQAQLRALAGGWYVENLQGKSFHNDDMGVDVQFSSEGKRTAFATSGNLRAGWRAEMVKTLPHLIQRAVKVAEHAPDARRAHDTVAFHTLVAPLEVNGKVLAAKITLRESLHDFADKRHKFYDLTALEIENGPEMSGAVAGVATGPLRPTGSEPSTVSVADLNRAINGESDAYFGVADVTNLKASALEQINAAFTHEGKVSIWDKTVGTMRNLAERAPAFKPVYESAQRNIDDVSMMANDAANMAPRLLPRVETLADLKKKPVSATDNKAVAKPLFEGTLMWGRDVDGKPMLADDLAEKYANLAADKKAEMLMSAGKIDEGVLKMWRGLPVEHYEKLLASRFESQMLKPGIVWTDEELKSRFNATAEQISLYREARAAIDRSIDMTARSDMLRLLGEDYAPMREAVLEAPNLETATQLVLDTLEQDAQASPDARDRLAGLMHQVRQRMDAAQGLQKAGYAPLSRFGRYTVDVVGKDGERLYFGMYESQRESNLAKVKLAQGFPDAEITQGTMSAEAYKLFAGVSPETLEQFGEMLGLDAKGNEAQDKAFQEYLKLTKNNHSALKRLIHRKGIAGYSEDVGRVLANFIYSNARAGAMGLNAGQMEEAIEAIPKEQGELRDLAMGLRSYIRDPQEEGQAVRGMLFAQYLGGSVASAFVNMTQPFQITMPWLSQYGGMRHAGAALAKALRDMGTKGFQYEADLAKALHDAEDDGTVSPQEIHQLMAQARGAGTLRSGDGTKMGDARAGLANRWEQGKVLWGQPFALAEQFNRRSTFIAAYRIAKERGMASPAEFARQAVLETQFVYSKANKPKWARGAIGGTLFTFKTYSVSYLELMHRMWTQGGPEGKRAVGWAVAMLLLMGGAGGLPFMEDAEDLIDGAGQLMGYNVSSKQWRKQLLVSVVGKEMGDFMEQGISGLPGAPVDVSGRLGMGNLIPGTGLLLTKQNRERDLTEIVGPAGDLITRGFTGGRKLLTGDVGGAVLEVSPAAVRNAAKGIDMAVSGMYKDTKGYKVLDTTLAEAAAKAIGFQPKSVAEVQEANSFMMRSRSFYTQTSSEIKAQWADALFRKDEVALERVRERLAAWNRNNPDQPIVVKMNDVWKKVREMGKDRTERIAATAPKAIRHQMREMAQEANR